MGHVIFLYKKALSGFNPHPQPSPTQLRTAQQNDPKCPQILRLLKTPYPRINLSTSDDIRREMARVYRETRFNKIMPNNGTKLVYMLINILRAYESTEIEKRLADLEKAHLKSDK